MTISTRRALTVLGLGASLAAAIGGCSGDDPEEGNPGNSTGDAGASSSSSSSGAGASSGVGPSSSSSGSSGSTSSSSGAAGTPFTRDLGSIYAGDVAAIAIATDELDAAGVTWTVAATPAGSAASAPVGASTAFRPDLPGAYTLVASGMSNGAARTGTFTLTAVEAEVVSARLRAGATGAEGSFGIRAGGSIIGGSRDIGCPRSTGALTSLDSRNLTFGDQGLAVWYAPPGVPSRAVYTDTVYGANDAGTDTSLTAATTLSGCAGANAATTIMPQAYHIYADATFRSDGARIAFLDPGKTGRPVFTVGFDGSEPFALGTVTNSVGRMAWKPDASLATLTSETAGWTVQVFPDQAPVPNPLPTPFLTCDGSVAHALVFLDDTHVLVAYTPTGGTDGLRIVHPGDDAAHTCMIDKLLADDSLGSIGADFALSPDKTKVAFTASASSLTQVYVVPVDGASPPQAINTAIGLAIDAGVGATDGQSAPNWMGTNSMLAWSSGGHITAARIDGTELAAGVRSRIVDVSADDGIVFRTTASRADCSVALVGAGSGGGALLGALALLVVRRRKRGA